jgi:hypothetical protein
MLVEGIAGDQMSYAIQCNSCGGWQSYVGLKQPRFILFNCTRCGKSASVYDKRMGGVKLNIINYEAWKKEKNTDITLSELVAIMNATRK